MMEPNRLCFYGVTDDSRNLCAQLKRIEEALKGGLGILQLRKKHMAFEEYVLWGRKVKELCDTYGVPLLINDFPEVCLACSARGVHLGQKDGDLLKARALLGKKAVIGATAHSLLEALEAEKKGADYLGVGAAFGSRTKWDAKAIDRKEYLRITQKVSIPVVAIGGICEENLSLLRGLGLTGAAFVSGLFSLPQEEIAPTAQRLKKQCASVFMSKGGKNESKTN